MNYAKHVKVGATPQTEAIRGREVEMTENSAGGYGFILDTWKQLDRFLVLGTVGGTYYASEKKLTRDNDTLIRQLLLEDPVRVVTRTAEISTGGLAQRNDPALFVLACALTDEKTRKAVLLQDYVPLIARTGTHFLTLTEMVKTLLGRTPTGRSIKRSLSSWFTSQDPEELAYQLAKYRNRSGWTAKDAIRVAHPRPTSVPHAAVLGWPMSDGTDYNGKPKYAFDKAGDYVCLNTVDRRKWDLGHAKMPVVMPKILAGYELAKNSEDPAYVAALIRQYGLTREMVPSPMLTQPEVLSALLEKTPVTAMIRNLGNYSKHGLLEPLSEGEAKVIGLLENTDALRKAKVHPLGILFALKTYTSGAGFRGSGTWPVNQNIVDALDRAFYTAFTAVVPTDKAIYLAVDVSRSMDTAFMDSCLSCREASAALAMVTAATEKRPVIRGFASATGATFYTMDDARMGVGMRDLKIGTRTRLDNVCELLRGIPMGGTDCALPMIDALNNKMEVDAFIIITDCETWAGNAHPSEALAQYRRVMQRSAKLVVVGMTATEVSIADPKDAGMLDIAGFSADVPAVIADFIRG